MFMLSGPHIARYCDAIAAIPHMISRDTFEVSTPPKSRYPLLYLISHRHIYAIPHFAACRAIIVRYPTKNNTKKLCDTIATSIARYEKYRFLSLLGLLSFMCFFLSLRRPDLPLFCFPRFFVLRFPLFFGEVFLLSFPRIPGVLQRGQSSFLAGDPRFFFSKAAWTGWSESVALQGSMCGKVLDVSQRRDHHDVLWAKGAPCQYQQKFRSHSQLSHRVQEVSEYGFVYGSKR